MLICFYRYFRTNHVKRFAYDRPFHRGGKVMDFAVRTLNFFLFSLTVLSLLFCFILFFLLFLLIIFLFFSIRFVTPFPHLDIECVFILQDLWLERTTITIASPLPGVLKWFPVVSTSMVSFKSSRTYSIKSI